MTWSCTIPGQPIGKGRPRFVGAKSGHPRAITPERTRRWEDNAAFVMRAEWGKPPLEGPVDLDVHAVLQRPKRLEGKKFDGGRLPTEVKPDADNILKAVMDALQKAGVVRDDAQVSHLTLSKLYAAKAEAPHVHISLDIYGGQDGSATKATV